MLKRLVWLGVLVGGVLLTFWVLVERERSRLMLEKFKLELEQDTNPLNYKPRDERGRKR